MCLSAVAKFDIGPYLGSPFLSVLLLTLAFSLLPDAFAQVPGDAEIPLAAGGEITLQAGNGGEITLIARRVTRRVAIERLYRDANVQIVWRNKAFADEIIRGRFSGSEDGVGRSLLARGNYVIVYRTESMEPRAQRIIVAGKDPPSLSQTVAQYEERVRQSRRAQDQRQALRRRQLQQQERQRQP